MEIIKMTKNETLARCRAIWAVTAKTGESKIDVCHRLFPHMEFAATCPLCEYGINSDRGDYCDACIEWEESIPYTRCMSIMNDYYNADQHDNTDEMKRLATIMLKYIDIAIAKFDATGDWR